MAHSATSPEVECPSNSPIAPDAIAFIVVAANSAEHTGPLLDRLRAESQGGDEIILLMRADRLDRAPREGRSWLRVVGVPATDLFTLRSHIPAVTRRPWLFVLEDHGIPGSGTIAAIRRRISADSGIDLIALLTKNLTSRSPWDWAAYLHGLAEVTAPLESAPPFSLATTAVVRRAALPTDHPLRQGEWEFRVIPGLYASGRFAYDNAIYIDHVKASGPLAHLRLHYHNNRACASLLHERFAMSTRTLCAEAWGQVARRPRRIANVISRRPEALPRHLVPRIQAIACASALGTLAGTFLGAGRSTDKLD